MNAKEIAKGDTCCIKFDDDKKNVSVQQSKGGKNNFKFDQIFDMESKQMEVYDAAARPIINSVLEGFNGTIFAYGQTSSGKTHTMMGPMQNVDNVEDKGITPRIFKTLFNRIDDASEDMEYSLKVSMCEIYNEKIKDLFDTKKNNLSIHQDRKGAIFIKNISEQWCSSEEQLINCMKKGNKSRTVAKTNMNDTSSRSHSILMLTLYIDNKEDGTCKIGKLFLVDLAGSEKISKTGATGQTLEEGKSINLSLTVLGRVINALTDPNQFSIPYRESTLTRLLSDSLGGNSKTCLIITASPHPSNDQETISTMRFGERARIVKNKAKINREYSVEELK